MGLDLADLFLTRPYYLGRDWTVQPFFGLRAGWIRQYFDVSGTVIGSSPWYSQETAMNTNCWGIGPRAGLQTNWLLGMGFSLFGDMSASLLYTRYTTISLRNTNTDGGSVVGTNNDFNAVRPNVDAGLGVRWGSYFTNQKYYFDISAAYNFLVFFSQNEMATFASVLSPFTGSSPGDLSINGVSIQTSFLF